MFNIILNNLVESTRKEGVGCVYEIDISPITDSNISATAKINIDCIGTICSIDFFKEYQYSDENMIDSKIEKISKKSFLDLLEDSSHIDISVA